VTEAEWLACTDPQRMLDVLRGRIGERRMRLFACGCCRTVRHLMTDPRSWDAVLVAERFADGSATGDELERAADVANTVYLDTTGRVRTRAAQAAQQACEWGDELWQVLDAWASAALALEGEALERGVVRLSDGELDDVMETWAFEASESGRPMGWTDVNAEAEMADLLRCIADNPFRPVAAKPSWFTTTAVALAQVIYADRAFDRLPILADALEEAGCDDADILTHLRSEGPHVRGCWAVDLVLGKE
jgi:hypothetical protein